MAIDPAGSPEVNPAVDTDYGSNIIGSPYSSTTEDLLDRIRRGIEALSGGGGGGGANKYCLSAEWMNSSDGPVYVVTLFDSTTGNIEIEAYDQPGGSVVVVSELYPISWVYAAFAVLRLDGNASGAASAWYHGSTLLGTTPIVGTVGKFANIPGGEYKYFDVRILNSSADDPAAGYYADAGKTRFYAASNGALTGPLGIQRGVNGQVGVCLDDLYFEAVGDCQIEITLTL